MKNDNTIPLVLGLGAFALLFLGTGTGDQKDEEISTTNSPIKLSPTNFVKSFIGDARESEKRTGTPALVTLAQGAIESEWNKKSFGNNFFGIKEGKGWTGETQLLRTWECGTTGDPKKDGITDQIIAIYPPNDHNGICGHLYSYRVMAKFRKYKKPADSFADHGFFLKANKRYQPAFQYTDPKLFTNAIAKAGYASAPNYASAVNSMIDSINKILTA